ncbi:MAG: transposase [Methanobacterium sp.]
MLKINLKKTSIINPNEDIIGFNDESRFNNIHNSGKTWHKKGRKNIITKTLNRESVNVIGFHSINGHSILSFPEKTNRITFCLHLIEVRSKNISNNNIQKILYELLEANEINEEFIKEEFKKQQITNEELQEKIYKATKKPFHTNTAIKKRIEKIFKRIEIKNKTILETQEKHLNLFLDENIKLKEELSNEKRIIIVLDNYSAHISKIAKKFTKFLNIKLIFLPTHSPKLNPIEQVWRAMKKKISSIDFKCIKKLIKKTKKPILH